jgi:hypothetical protein
MKGPHSVCSKDPGMETRQCKPKALTKEAVTLKGSHGNSHIWQEQLRVAVSALS